MALHMTNKQLKDSFKRTDVNGQIKCCTDYEITKARMHSESHGAAADRPKQKTVRICTSAEDVAFLLDFLHNPETVERSSYKTASCEGKKGSWVSELLGGGTQPVLWLKRNKASLYEQYKLECNNTQRKPIGRILRPIGFKITNICLGFLTFCLVPLFPGAYFSKAPQTSGL